MKAFTFCDSNIYLAAAVNSKIEILSIEYESLQNIELNKKQTIENQIAVFEMKIKTVCKKPGVQGVEILVADIMKSFNVYFIRFEPRTEENDTKNFKLRKLDSMYNSVNLYSLPYGQWCTSSEKV